MEAADQNTEGADAEDARSASSTAVAQVSHTATMLYWQICNIINTVVLQEKRVEYGKRIGPPLAAGNRWELLETQKDDSLWPNTGQNYRPKRNWSKKFAISCRKRESS